VAKPRKPRLDPLTSARAELGGALIALDKQLTRMLRAAVAYLKQRRKVKRCRRKVGKLEQPADSVALVRNVQEA